MLNKDIISSKFPLAYNKLVEYIRTIMGTANPAIKQMDEKLANQLMDFSSTALFQSKEGIRTLYGLFDQYGIFFHVAPAFSGGDTCNKWYCSINDDEIDETIFYPSRVEAESNGFSRCFELLENKLK